MIANGSSSGWKEVMSANDPDSLDASSVDCDGSREKRGLSPVHDSGLIQCSSTVEKVVEAIVEDSRSKSKEYLERSRSGQAGE